jgi:hypothetical protein
MMGSHEDFCLLGCDFVSSDRSLPRFGGTCFFRLQNTFHFLSVLKMEASDFSEMSESIYQDKRRHILEDILHDYSRENFKSRTWTSYKTMSKEDMRGSSCISPDFEKQCLTTFSG